MISYIIWNGSPEIFSINSLGFALRWYGLLFALGFLISQQVLYYIYRQEDKPEKDVDTLTIYMVLATILGARLGHVIFYQPELFITDPLSILLPFELSPFRFTGLQGLASHGGAFGILFALWLYSRKKKPGQNYIQVLDRIVIVVALTGALIRLGNFFNSEIVGLPSNNPLSVVFINRVTEGIKDYKGDNNPTEFIKVEKDRTLPEGSNGRMPINIYVIFKKGISQSDAVSFVEGDVKHFLTYYNEFVDEPVMIPLNYKMDVDSNGNLAAKVSTFGIARHPAQLYESISCVILFIILFLMWKKDKANIPPGRIFGVFMIVLWSLRFAYEFLKENQVSFEDELPLNMGQILSIPLVIVGVFILIWSFRNQKQNNSKT
ncbi:MAG TPA: prolipoprotein diacylglyceryl transferase [Cyclobacteriaceae bacterium]|nr:prolipoprotein diacylglyceryl transferase [Cyclobacteriaceae bacterium]